MRRTVAVLAAFTMLAACNKQGQNRYNEADVGVAKTIEYATVVHARQVAITGKNTGTGALLGAGTGLGAGSYVNGSGRGWAMAGAAILGAVAGSAAEQSMSDSTGMEYIVKTQKGRMLSLVQNINEGDVVFKHGDKVMVQECEAGEYYKKCVSGGYQRLLPVD